MTLVKVCGLTDAGDVATCAAAGVDRLGFVVEYPLPVPWSLSRARAAMLMEAVPGPAARVAVVGGDAGAILAIAEATGADLLQLHGDESEAVVAAVAARGHRVIKALRVDPDAPPTPDDLARQAGRFVAAGAREILLDAKTASRPAGTGRALDRALAREVARALAVPLILAGGLTPENVGAAVRHVRPAGVDALSGVEDARHRKDAARVRAFVAAVRAAAGPVGVLSRA